MPLCGLNLTTPDTNLGGDNSDGAVGTFYEGVITSGYTSDETDDKVQANIVAAGYGK